MSDFIISDALSLTMSFEVAIIQINFKFSDHELP